MCVAKLGLVAGALVGALCSLPSHAARVDTSAKEVHIDLLFVGPASKTQAEEIRNKVKAPPQSVIRKFARGDVSAFEVRIGEIRGLRTVFHIHTYEGPELSQDERKALLREFDVAAVSFDCSHAADSAKRLSALRTDTGSPTIIRPQCRGESAGFVSRLGVNKGEVGNAKPGAAFAEFKVMAKLALGAMKKPANPVQERRGSGDNKKLAPSR